MCLTHYTITLKWSLVNTVVGKRCREDVTDHTCPRPEGTPMNPRPAPVQQHDAQADRAQARRMAMMRCVIAAETYRITGQLPAWVREGR